MSEPAPIGRRERKKAATRKHISDVATRMFLERGFDQVSIREVADAADVSPTTVFAHFPQKEALVFDEGDAQRELLVSAVRDRPTGVGIIAALETCFQREYDDMITFAGAFPHEAITQFGRLVRETPALAEFEARMWLQHEDALAATIAADLGEAEPDDRTRAFSRFVLQVWQLMNDAADPERMLRESMRILESGWTPGRPDTTERD